MLSIRCDLFELHVIHVVMSHSTTIQRNVILDFVVIVSRNETMSFAFYTANTLNILGACPC